MKRSWGAARIKVVVFRRSDPLTGTRCRKPVSMCLVKWEISALAAAPRCARGLGGVRDSGRASRAILRTTLDISDEAYYIAKGIARDQKKSLGRLVGELILQSTKGEKGASIEISDYGFPTFRCARPVTSEDVKALDDEE